jgi:glutamine amidotransferase
LSVAIVDVGLCNLRSVENAVYALGHDPLRVHDADELGEADRVVLPGVGNFRAASEALEARGLREGLADFARERPMLGICLGMHLLATSGEEGGGSPGLDLLKGRVTRLEPGGGRRVPHVGWNAVELARPHPVLARVKPGRDFYFVHSFRLVPDGEEDVVARTEYGAEFVSVAANGKAVGVQFHPEKSQRNGLLVLEAFLDWNGRS